MHGPASYHHYKFSEGFAGVQPSSSDPPRFAMFRHLVFYLPSINSLGIHPSGRCLYSA
jgi:hypothetical protein